MAFSDAQRSRIVFELGYPGTTVVEGNVNYNSVIDDRLTNIDSETETLAIALLAEIATVKAKFAGTSVKGNVEKVGDIKFDTSRSKTMVSNEYKRLLRELSTLLDIPIKGKGSMNFQVVV